MNIINLEEIKSDNIPLCLDCSISITKENDSGWEAFTGKVPGETQPLCVDCDKERDNNPIIKE